MRLLQYVTELLLPLRGGAHVAQAVHLLRRDLLRARQVLFQSRQRRGVAGAGVGMLAAEFERAPPHLDFPTGPRVHTIPLLHRPHDGRAP
jgi:hypothetical protein